MWLWLGIIFLIVKVIMFMILLSRITVRVVFTYNDNKKDLILTIIWMKIVKIKRSIPVMEFDEENLSLETVQKDQLNGFKNENKKKIRLEDLKQQGDTLKENLQIVKNIIPDLKRTLKSIRLHEFEWATSIGLKSADHTAIFSGTLYSIKGMISSFLMNLLQNITTPNIKVNPKFNRRLYETELRCILSFQIGQIMRDMIRVMYKYVKMKKVGQNE